MQGFKTVVARLVRNLFRHVQMQRTRTIALERRISMLKGRIADLRRIDGAPLLGQLDAAFGERIAHHCRASEELLVGWFDQDGGILWRFGPIADLPTISKEQFQPKGPHPLSLVVRDGRLCVRKQFGKRRGRFVQELEAMISLTSAGCPVPALVDVDWDTHAIVMGFVHGDVLRELLARAGALVRDRDVRASPADRRREARIDSGRKRLGSVINGNQIRAVGDGLRAIHAAGYVLDDIKYGNIIIARSTGAPIFIDFERAMPTAGVSAAVQRYLRDRDIRKLVEHFGRAANETAAERMQA